MEEAVNALSTLPGVGRKTALRFALHLVRSEKEQSLHLADAIRRMVNEIKLCENCFAYSDDLICEICRNPARHKDTICIVESIRDQMAIEDLQHFQGVYHVLGGLISPIDGIGPSELKLDKLFERIRNQQVKELILAVRPSIEGDTTSYYISRQLSGSPVKISMLARGVSFGSDLEFADDLTLSRSLIQRVPYAYYDKQNL